MTTPVPDLTLLQLFKTLEGDFQFIIVCKLGRVVQDIHPEERNDRHVEA